KTITGSGLSPGPGSESILTIVGIMPKKRTKKGGTMLHLLILILLLLSPVFAWAVPPAPGPLTITLSSVSATAATFSVSWDAVPLATSYTFSAGYNDGQSLQFGGVSGATSLALIMMYHSSGTAQVAFVCVHAVDNTGPSVDQSCNSFTVPAPPIPITTVPKVTLTWQDNSTNEDNFRIERA